MLLVKIDALKSKCERILMTNYVARSSNYIITV